MALVATMGSAAAAFQIDPEVLTQVATPPTGLWIPAPATGEIVRVDAASGAVTARVDVGDPGSELVLAERDHGVIVVDRTSGRVALVDPALHEVVRSVGSVPAAESGVDIGPEGVVAASGSQVALVDLDVTESVSASVPAGVRSAAADGDGARVENGSETSAIAADGSVGDGGRAEGVLVRVDDDVYVASPTGVHTLGGNRVACFDGVVENPTHVVGTSIDWVVAIAGSTVHVADLSNGDCAAVALAGSGAVLGRPVVSGRRVFVPERHTGTVHIVEPSREVDAPHPVLPAGDMRLRARGDLVIAYDAATPVAAMLDRDGVVQFVDTSVDERGIAAVVGEEGTATVVDGGEDEGVGATGADGVSTNEDAPVIDAGVLATNLQNPADDSDNVLPDDELVANFAFSATTVTVGEAVRFVDGSTGGPDGWLWDFGDGTGAQGPEAEKAWDEPGTYPVTLTVSRGDETDEISLAITVVPAEVPLPPNADFVFSSTVVSVGNPIFFEDRSDGEIERWRWDFGDGTTATEPNVTKSWDAPGRYAVQLIVANEQGSDSAVIYVEVIEGLRPPVAVLTVAANDVDLGAPLAFRGSSSTDPASFSWDFGDGRTSSGTDVVHVFLTEGVFTVTLTAANAAGVSTATVDILVAPPTQPPIAAIGTLPTVIEVGDLVTLSSLSTNSPDSETWAFGDGETATGARVTHVWEAPGSYLLSLTATNGAGSNTVNVTVEVQAELPPPIAQIGDFNESPWVGDTTVFIDASIDATAWLWDFGDGVTSNAPDPLHTFTSAGQKIVTLTVSNRNGSDTTSVVVEPRLEPIASFTVPTTAIRAGDSLEFTDQSVNAVSWFWDFGDETTSAVQSPVHTFTETGTFPVNLTVRNATGDEAHFGPVEINVDPAPPLLSGMIKLPDDTGAMTTLTSASFAAVADPASGPIDLYQADFGDGSPVELSPTGTFSHAYGASGTYVVTMQARGPLGDFSEPVTRSFTVVDPRPPSVAISESVPVTAEVGMVTLAGVAQSRSGPIATWRWEVTGGGGLWEYTGQTVDHLFEAAGEYNIKLIAESPVAAVPDDEAEQGITLTIPPAPRIDSLVANPSPTTTGVLVTFTPAVVGSVSTWEWDYEGGGYVVGGPTGQYIFNSPGDRQITLRVTGPFGQQDVMSVDLEVNPRPSPTAPVAVPGLTVLTGTNVSFTSSDAGGLTGLRWDWEITNGATTIPFSDVGPSINHLFPTAGSWTVTVTATDALGITGTNLVFVTVEDPVPPLNASFVAAPTGTPLQIQLTDTSSGPPIDTWTWSFGDPGAVGNPNAQNPLVTFSAPGTYQVTLTVTSGAAVDDVIVPVTVA